MRRSGNAQIWTTKDDNVRLLTPEDVSEQLAVSRSTVLRLIADKAIPVICLRRGKRKAVYRIRQEILDRWILSRETKQHVSAPLAGEPKSNAAAIKAANGKALDKQSSAKSKLS